MNLAFQELIFFILGGAGVKEEEEEWWRWWVRKEGTKNANITPYRLPRNLNDAQKHYHTPRHFPLLPISSIFCLLPLRLCSLTPLLKVILLGRRSISLILSFVDYFIYLFIFPYKGRYSTVFCILYQLFLVVWHRRSRTLNFGIQTGFEFQQCNAIWVRGKEDCFPESRQPFSYFNLKCGFFFLFFFPAITADLKRKQKANAKYHIRSWYKRIHASTITAEA